MNELQCAIVRVLERHPRPMRATTIAAVLCGQWRPWEVRRALRRPMFVLESNGWRVNHDGDRAA